MTPVNGPSPLKMSGAGDPFSRLVGYIGNGNTDDQNFATGAVLIVRDSSNSGFATFRNGTEYVATAISLNTNHRIGMIYDGGNVTSYLDNSVGAWLLKSALMAATML